MIPIVVQSGAFDNEGNGFFLGKVQQFLEELALTIVASVRGIL